MGKGSSIGSCVSFIFTVIAIVALIYTIRIFNFSEVDPFKTTTKADIKPYIKDLELYDNFEVKKCKCGEEIVNDFCTEEQRLSGCVDFSSNLLNDKKEFLRYLVEDEKCKDFQHRIIDLKDTDTLDLAFKLNLDMVHKMALGILIIIIANFVVIGLILFVSCGSICCGEGAAVLLLPCIPCILIVAIFSDIVNLVLFIILCVNYYSGDVRDYVDFLDCSCIKDRNGLSNKFKDIEELKSSFTTFMILTIIYIILSCANSGSNAKKNE